MFRMIFANSPHFLAPSTKIPAGAVHVRQARPRHGGQGRRNTTPNLLTKILPTKIRRLKISGEFPIDLRIPPLKLKLKILLESNPLKSRIPLCQTPVGLSNLFFLRMFGGALHGQLNLALVFLPPTIERELRGSQGMGVVLNNWFDHVFLSILYRFKPSCRPMFKPPSLGPP